MSAVGLMALALGLMGLVLGAAALFRSDPKLETMADVAEAMKAKIDPDLVTAIIDRVVTRVKVREIPGLPDLVKVEVWQHYETEHKRASGSSIGMTDPEVVSYGYRDRDSTVGNVEYLEKVRQTGAFIDERGLTRTEGLRRNRFVTVGGVLKVRTERVTVRSQINGDHEWVKEIDQTVDGLADLRPEFLNRFLGYVEIDVEGKVVDEHP